MGTRADFYVGRGTTAEWIGSVGYDGSPSAVLDALGAPADEASYRRAVVERLKRDDGTPPELGWPWSWDDSRLTDHAYAYESGLVYESAFGRPWRLLQQPLVPHAEDAASGRASSLELPNMSARKNLAWGERSGFMLLGH